METTQIEPGQYLVNGHDYHDNPKINLVNVIRADGILYYYYNGESTVYPLTSNPKLIKVESSHN